MALIPRKTNQDLNLSGLGVVYVDVQGFRDLTGRFTHATEDLIQQRADFMHRIGKQYVKKVKKHAPVKSGTYKESIHYGLDQKTNSSISLSIRAMDPLTKWIVGGTKPHLIRSARGPKTALEFFWQSGPKIGLMGRRSYIYNFRSVHHPGTKANPLFENAALEMDPIIGTELNDMASRWSIKLESF